jgi:23S rRNA maturation-related 3'-5' exoribonuclease YhaM
MPKAKSKSQQKRFDALAEKKKSNPSEQKVKDALEELRKRGKERQVDEAQGDRS